VPVNIEFATVEDILRDFHDGHERVYTFRLAEAPVEFVTFRLTAVRTGATAAAWANEC
jgi:N-methylhydantoinase A/oxoprolinase/acetone carboxylase beta subunit